MGYKKKLIEVALPLDVINVASAKEKSIRQGHPSTMHIWWARRTLAATKAVLFSSIIDDPSNYLPAKEADKERKKIFRLIEQFVQWKQEDRKTINKKISELINKSTNNKPPCVLDPFSGGGTIPYAAQTLGLDAYGSDLNPVAVVVSKSLVEIPPKFNGKPPINPASKKSRIASQWTGCKGLAEDIRYYGDWIKNCAYKKIGNLYPKTEKGETIVAWLWCRTVKCQNPACQVEIPLTTNLELSENKYILPYYSSHKLLFKLSDKKPSFGLSTKEGRGSHFKCINCSQISNGQYIKKESCNQQLGQRIMCAVIEQKRGFSFVEVDKKIEEMALKNKPSWKPNQKMNRDTVDLVSGRGYGFYEWSDLFLPRQLIALTTFCDLIKDELKKKVLEDLNSKDNLPLNEESSGDCAYAEALCVYLSLALGRSANYWSSFTFWGGSFIVQTFGRQAIPMVWDFSEVNPFSDSTGNWDGAVKWVAKVLEITDTKSKGKIINLDSSKVLDFEGINPLISTDPPYYNNINYADLSDFFYVWMRKSLGYIYPDVFATVLTPKSEELIAAPHRFGGDAEKAKQHFLEGIKRCFKLMKNKMNDEYPLTVYYAYKQTEESSEINEEQPSAISSTGWEIMLNGLIDAGFKIVGTWPMRTERSQGLKTGSNFLASSIVIVCRSRSDNAPLSTRREFITTLKKELPSALKNLQEAGITPVDMAQSAIGPGMAVYSKYSKVLEADGTPMSVRTALQIINQELDTYFTEQESDMDKETRFCIAWFEQFGWKDAPFDDANTLATAKGTAVNALERAGVIYAKAGRVRLLKRNELDTEWNPTNNKKLTVWECVQHLIRILEEKGESVAADVLKKIGGLSEPIKELAYRLYALCDKKGWTEDAIAYNSLISSWQSVTDKAQFAEQVSEETKKKIKDKEQKTLNNL